MGVKKSNLYVSSNFSNQKKELNFKLVRPFRKNVATLSRFLGDAEGKFGSWSSQALPLISSDICSFTVTSQFFELFCWC